MHWEQCSLLGYNGWQLFFGDTVNNTRHHLLPTVVMVINRSTPTARNKLSWELIHKSLKMVFAGCGMCVLTILWCVQTAGHVLLTTIMPFLDDGPYLTLDLVVNPVQWQNRLSGSLWLWASFLFMGIIACSTSLLRHEMFELLVQSTDVVLASLVQLEKGKRKERRNEQ